MRTKYVYLGRFSPFHKGHQNMVEKMVAAHGSDNVLIMVGSSNAYNERTPYTFEERKKMINTLFPDIEVIPLPDGKPGLVYFDGSTNDVWLSNIQKIEAEINSSFVFYGGSAEDLEVLAERFKTIILVDRKTCFEGLSATLIREALKTNNQETLDKYLDPRITNQAIAGFKKFNEQNEKR